MSRVNRLWLSCLAAVLFVLLPSCGEDDLRDLLRFGVTVDIDRQTVPGLLPLPSCDIEDLGALLPFVLQPITVDLRAEEELEGQGAISFFESVHLSEAILRIVAVPEGDSDDWDSLDSVRLYADDPATADPPVLVAELDPVPSNVMVLTIPGTGVNIAPIASAEEFVVSGEVTGRLPCDEVTFEGEADFDVEVL